MYPGMVAAPATSSPSNPKAEQDATCEVEREYREHFSKSILNDKLKQFGAGKYTRKYIESYLEFCHLSGYITNLEYLEIRGKFPKE